MYPKLSADLILYDRIWLQEYIEHVRQQRELAVELQTEIQREMFQCSPEQRIIYSDALYHIGVLKHSLEVTETVLRRYLDQMQTAAVHFQNACLDIEIPDLFE